MSLEAVLFLFSAYTTGTTLSRGTWSASLMPLSGYLGIFLVGFFGFLIYFLLEQTKRFIKIRFVVVLITTLLTLLMTAVPQISLRRTHATKYLNDSLVQSVEAAKGVLHGENPYTMDFGKTAFSIFHSASGGDPSQNIARQHYVYPPFQFLVFVPLVWLSSHLQVYIDYPSVFLLLFLIIVGLLAIVAPSWHRRILLVLLTLGNPFLWVNVINGNNDTLLAAFLIGGAVLWKHRRYVLGGLCLGLAVATKQTAWLVVPVWGYWLWRQYRGQHVSRNTMFTTIATTLGIAGIVYLPYMVWNVSAMYDDMVRYLSGAIPGSLPISGITVAQYLHLFHIVSSPWTTASVLPLTLPALVLILWFVFWRLKRSSTLADLLTYSSIVLLVAILFNRMGSDNYFIPVFLLVVGGYMAQEAQQVDHV